jgi:hypothetical protein
MVNVAHHGFTLNLNGTTPTAVFISGNYSQSPLKMVDADDATQEIELRDNNGADLACPPLADLIAALAQGEDAFAALPAGNNNVLDGRPNHLFIHPVVFQLTGGAQSIRAKTLALAITNYFRTTPVMVQNFCGTTLAFLWAVEQNQLAKVAFSTDLPDSAQLNRTRVLLSNKLSGNPQGDGSSYGLLQFVQDQEATRKRERQEDQDRKSFMAAFAPGQAQLIDSMCTASYAHQGTRPDMIKALFGSSYPHKAIQLVQSRTQLWKGTFSHPPFFRFMATGFMSTSEDETIPGGFTFFMFHPRTKSVTGFKSFMMDKHAVREALGQDMPDDAVKAYMAAGFYEPTDENELDVMLQTAKKMLELILAPTQDGTVATEGIDHVISHINGHTTLYNRRFQQDPKFGTKLLYLMDRTMQEYFKKLSGVPPNDVPSAEIQNFLKTRASSITGNLDQGLTLAVELPPCFLQIDVGDEQPLVSSSTNAQHQQQQQLQQQQLQQQQQKDSNPEKVPTWLLPQGKNYQDAFPKDSPLLKGWPKLGDTRNPKKRFLCVKYQAKGFCQTNCPRAHVPVTAMPAAAKQFCDTRFQQAYST